MWWNVWGIFLMELDALCRIFLFCLLNNLLLQRPEEWTGSFMAWYCHFGGIMRRTVVFGGPLGALHGSAEFWKEGWRWLCSFGNVSPCLPADSRKALGKTFLFLCPFLMSLPSILQMGESWVYGGWIFFFFDYYFLLFFSPRFFFFNLGKGLWYTKLLWQEDVQQSCLKAGCHLRGDPRVLSGSVSICLE